MIAPDMATMLCFVFTDAKIPADALQTMLKKGVDASFNCTTVDSDTSTSDTVLLIATGQAKHPRIPPADGNAARNRMLADFARALNEVLLDLALQVIRDGEGAQKLVRIDVTGAANAEVGEADRDGGGELAAGEDRDRRGGRQLGPHRHGCRQIRRTGGPRQAVDRRRRRVDGAGTAASSPAMTRRRSSPT